MDSASHISLPALPRLFDSFSTPFVTCFFLHVSPEVPVSEFGAALLRGMGWKGPAIDGESDGAGAGRDVVPRHQRLGLGAQPKPPEEVMRMSMSVGKARR